MFLINLVLSQLKKENLNVSIPREKINISSLIRYTPNGYCELNIHKHYDSRQMKINPCPMMNKYELGLMGSNVCNFNGRKCFEHFYVHRANSIGFLN